MIVKPDVERVDYGCPVFPTKYRYPSRKKARAAAVRQSTLTRTEIEPYPCGDHFHIGHDWVGRRS